MAQNANQSRLVQIIKITPEVSSTELLLPSTAMLRDSRLIHLTFLPGILHLENVDKYLTPTQTHRYEIKEKKKPFSY